MFILREYDWADALELRDDVDFGEEGDETGDIMDILCHIITSSDLGDKMTPKKAKEMIEELRAGL
jgi:hypothetical protein